MIARHFSYCLSFSCTHFRIILQVKVLRKPRFDINKLLELHGDGSGATVVDESGVQIERPEGYEPPVLDSV